MSSSGLSSKVNQQLFGFAGVQAHVVVCCPLLDVIHLIFRCHLRCYIDGDFVHLVKYCCLAFGLVRITTIEISAFCDVSWTHPATTHGQTAAAFT